MICALNSAAAAIRFPPTLAIARHTLVKKGAAGAAIPDTKNPAKTPPTIRTAPRNKTLKDVGGFKSKAYKTNPKPTSKIPHTMDTNIGFS